MSQTEKANLGQVNDCIMCNLALPLKEERVAVVDPPSTPSQRVDGLTSPHLATLEPWANAQLDDITLTVSVYSFDTS